MTQRTRSLERLPSTEPEDFAVMDILANALDKLSRAQTNTTPRSTFKALDFNSKEDVETFNTSKKLLKLMNGQTLPHSYTSVRICKMMHAVVEITPP